MRSLAVAMYCVLALSASGRSMRSWQPDDVVENYRIFSANGRFCLVQRYFPGVGDFESIRYADVDWNGPSDTATAALYEIRGEKRVLISALAMPQPFPGVGLVADSGRFFAGFMPIEDADGLALVIYDRDGRLVRTLNVGDLFTPSDIEAIGMSQLPVAPVIRFDDQLQREIVVFAVPSTLDPKEKKYGEVRIDPADGTVLDAKRDIHPPLRVWATPSEGVESKRRTWEPKDCGSHPDAVRIASKQLAARAVKRVVPEYPPLGRKVRLAGDVWAEIEVSETGEVVATCIQGLPFGFDPAVEAAVRKWKFTPYESDGRPVRVTSEIVFHFRRVEHGEWAEIVGTFSPQPASNSMK